MARSFLPFRYAILLPLTIVFLVLTGKVLAASPPTPFVPGPYAVGCSNVAQDFSRIGSGETANDYWEGVPAGTRGRYVTDLLSDPANALVANTPVPDDRELFSGHAAQTLPFAILVCYPTSPDNPRPAYALPDGRTVPHMQQGAQPPIWPDATTRWPMLVFSHGLTGSPLTSDYLEALTEFASFGYVVVAPFHGDLRFADIKIQDLSDAVYAALHFSSFIELQAMRPLSDSAAISYVLAHPSFAPRLDSDKIGVFGASLGGEGALLAVGARLTTTVGQSSKQVLFDPRIKAVVGYVPYFGNVLPAFGRDQKGLDGVTVPFMAISGTADTTAPLPYVIQGMTRLTASRELVTLQGVPHAFDYASANDIFTWSVTFLAAHAQDDRLARATLARMMQVPGGGDDRVLIDYTAPAALAPGERDVVEFYNASLDHYFITAEPAEAAMLDAGIIVPGWARTGFAFKAYAQDAGPGVPTCRFFGTPGVGPNSHFYTIDARECARVRSDPHWQFEGLAFAEEPAAGGLCPANRVPVTRLYNNGMGGQASHRFITSHSESVAMVASGWLVEGPVFCAPP